MSLKAAHRGLRGDQLHNCTDAMLRKNLILDIHSMDDTELFPEGITGEAYNSSNYIAPLSPLNIRRQRNSERTPTRNPESGASKTLSPPFIGGKSTLQVVSPRVTSLPGSPTWTQRDIHELSSPKGSPKGLSTSLAGSFFNNGSSFQSRNSVVNVAKIKVVVRKRPLNKREAIRRETDTVEIPSDTSSLLVVHEPKQKVDLTAYVEQHEFIFDAVLGEDVSNDEVYAQTVEPIVPSIFKSTKATCFAYGQTGSGKTYTMQPLPLRAAKDMLDTIAAPFHADEALVLWVSFFEIYGGKVYDLLNDRRALQIRENDKREVCIVGLKEFQVSDAAVVERHIQRGSVSRSTGSTGANEESSRSHAILQLVIKSHKAPPKGRRFYPRNGSQEEGDMVLPEGKLVGKLSFIDLAGSERGADTTDNDKQTRMEGAEINKSLLALKECIRALDAGQNHIPFRGSKLTEVLRDSFVGNSRTVMVSCISPGSASVEHTLNTLRYADRVKGLSKGGKDAPIHASGTSKLASGGVASLYTRSPAKHRGTAMHADKPGVPLYETSSPVSPHSLNDRHSDSLRRAESAGAATFDSQRENFSYEVGELSKPATAMARQQLAAERERQTAQVGLQHKRRNPNWFDWDVGEGRLGSGNVLREADNDAYAKSDSEARSRSSLSRSRAHAPYQQHEPSPLPAVRREGRPVSGKEAGSRHVATAEVFRGGNADLSQVVPSLRTGNVKQQTRGPPVANGGERGEELHQESTPAPQSSKESVDLLDSGAVFAAGSKGRTASGRGPLSGQQPSQQRSKITSTPLQSENVGRLQSGSTPRDAGRQGVVGSGSAVDPNERAAASRTPIVEFGTNDYLGQADWKYQFDQGPPPSKRGQKAVSSESRVLESAGKKGTQGAKITFTDSLHVATVVKGTSYQQLSPTSLSTSAAGRPLSPPDSSPDSISTRSQPLPNNQRLPTRELFEEPPHEGGSLPGRRELGQSDGRREGAAAAREDGPSTRTRAALARQQQNVPSPTRLSDSSDQSGPPTPGSLRASVEQEEMAMLTAHRTHLRESMEYVKLEMRLLNDAEGSRELLDLYITEASQLLSRKLDGIHALQTKLARVKRRHREEARSLLTQS